MKLPLLLALLFQSCAYTRMELANKVHGTSLVTSANLRGFKVTMTPRSLTMEAAAVNHSIPTKEIGNNIAKGGAALAPLLGAGAVGL